MKIHSILLAVCLIISTGCLGAGYVLAGYWLILPVFPVVLILRTMLNKRSVSWSTSGFLVVYVILAAAGIIVEVSLELMVIACMAVLVCWDLMLFEESIARNLSGKTGLVLGRHHMQSLTLAASGGLILSIVSANINLQFPFVLIVFLVLTALGSLTYGLEFIVKKKQRAYSRMERSIDGETT